VTSEGLSNVKRGEQQSMFGSHPTLPFRAFVATGCRGARIFRSHRRRVVLGIAAALENCSLLAAGVAVAVGVVLRKPGFDKRIVWLVGGSQFRAFDPQSEPS
jgi:hypothetical protein